MGKNIAKVEGGKTGGLAVEGKVSYVA